VDTQPTFPIRAAFYYPWFPEAWNQNGINPYTRYTPTLGYYDSSSPSVLANHLDAMTYAGMDAGIASWWGQGSRTDGRISTLLNAASGTPFRWSLYYETESQGDPSATTIRADLDYIMANYGRNPTYLRVSGKPVLFVYAGGTDACPMAQRWVDANAAHDFYIVLKVFSGYRTCAAQPDSWHQYSPARYADTQTGYSVSISPGFWEAGQTERLARSLDQWRLSVQTLAASTNPWQLVMTFNEWGEGTIVESAAEWTSPSGYGQYLDALHDALVTGTNPPPSTLTPTSTPTTASGGVAYMIGVGDVATCAGTGDEETAAIVQGLLAQYPDASIALFGDTAYESGTPTEYTNCYQPNWGTFKSRTKPAVGNHEYLTSGATGYYSYFGTAAGDPSKGYYSYDLGAWHIIALNSQCSGITGGCSVGGAQEAWLRQDLAAHPNACTLAYWHHPRWSSGNHGSLPQTDAFWRALYLYGADVIMAGHDHDLEVLAPLDPDGNIDQARGIRSFVVGTGGKSLIGFPAIQPFSEAHSNSAFGVMLMTLRAGSYAWEFRPVAGKTFTTSGTGACH
jgi:hypothetical protein